MSDTALRRLADALLAISAVVLLATIVFAAIELARGGVKGNPADYWSGFIFLVDGMVFSAVGTLIAHQQPRNRIGWLLIAVGTSWALALSMSIYADYGITVAPGSLPAPALVNALTQWMWVPAVGLMATFVVLLFPAGAAASWSGAGTGCSLPGPDRTGPGGTPATLPRRSAAIARPDRTDRPRATGAHRSTALGALRLRPAESYGRTRRAR